MMLQDMRYTSGYVARINQGAAIYPTASGQISTAMPSTQLPSASLSKLPSAVGYSPTGVAQGGGPSKVAGIMNQASSQVASVIAEDLIEAVNRAAANYTGSSIMSGGSLKPTYSAPPQVQSYSGIRPTARTNVATPASQAVAEANAKFMANLKDSDRQAAAAKMDQLLKRPR